MATTEIPDTDNIQVAKLAAALALALSVGIDDQTTYTAMLEDRLTKFELAYSRINAIMDNP